MKTIFLGGAGALLVFILAATLSPIEMRPETIVSVNFDRMAAFFCFAVVLAAAFPRYAIAVGVFAIVCAFGSEALQLTTDSRHGQWADAVFKASGGALGALAVVIFHNMGAFRNKVLNVFGGKQAIAETEIPVQSNMISAIYFSPENGRLRVKMRNGEERQFEGVGLGAVLELSQAPSPGKHYVENVRSKFTRIAA